MAHEREYRYIIVEVFAAPNENSRHKIRARPIPGQWAGPEIRIECPTSIRYPENVGELYRMLAKFKDTSTADQLYTSYHWAPKRVTRAEAEALIAAKDW